MPGFHSGNISLQPRIRISLGVVICSFFVLILRLWYLQIVRGEYFRNRSMNNRLRTVFVSAPRGLILDRNYKILVKNRPSFNIELVEEDCPDVKETLLKLERVIGLPAGALADRKLSSVKRQRFEPKVIMRDVSRDIVAKVSAWRHDLPGIIVGTGPVRDYVYGDLAAHTLGYIREISQSQLESERYRRSDYRPGDLIGQYGLESEFEEWLRGIRGRQLVEVNARGTRIGEYAFSPEHIGSDLVLTLDYTVQKAADDALKGKKGAVVALNPETGEILALSSSPGFDPNIFTRELSPAVWRGLHGEGKPLTNRALQGAYPPGSIFKIVMAVAGLSENVISPAKKVFCPGYLYFGGRSYRCHKHSGHGTLSLRDAVIQSCDVYFYTLGNWLGIDRIHKYALMLGLGRKTGLNLGFNENPGLIPSTKWKKEYYKDRNPSERKWYPGETLSVSIGQGAVLVTPLQAAVMVSAVVNGGRIVRPYIVSRIVSSEGAVLREFRPEDKSRAEISPKVLDTVRAAMIGVVNHPKGTGKRARLDDESITVGGKTGTAQVVSLNSEAADERFGDHAWFISFAPAENPEIAVAVLIENGGHGGVAAAPVSRQVMEAYFRGRVEGVAD